MKFIQFLAILLNFCLAENCLRNANCGKASDGRAQCCGTTQITDKFGIPSKTSNLCFK